LTVQLNQIRVASPCPVSWEQMTGDNRVRFCGECQLNVYNFAELTRTEAENLLGATEGRICGRLYRRADGTIITKDCPVGLRAVRRRMAKAATAAFAALRWCNPDIAESAAMNRAMNGTWARCCNHVRNFAGFLGTELNGADIYATLHE